MKIFHKNNNIFYKYLHIFDYLQHTCFYNTGNIVEPPSTEGIDSAIIRLQDVGAFDAKQQLTALGEHLSALPVDVRIGKLMLFGAIFQVHNNVHVRMNPHTNYMKCLYYISQCVDSVLTIAACLSYKTPFVSPFSKQKEASAKKKEFALFNSDQLTVLNAYKVSYQIL